MLRFSNWKIATVLSVCFIAIFMTFGNFFNWNFTKQLNLGLDLQGGSHLLLSIDFDYYMKEQVNNLNDEIKYNLRKKKIKAIPKVKILEKDGSLTYKVAVNLKDKGDVKSVKKFLRKINEDLNVKASDKTLEVTYSNAGITKMKQKLLRQSIEIVRRRIDETGTKEPIIQAQGESRILVQVPGLESPDEIKSMLGKTAKLTFHFVSGSTMGELSVASLNSQRLPDREGNMYSVEKKVILSGDLLTDANVTYDQGAPAVSFKFNSIGTRKFSEITRNGIGRILAIVLDNTVVTAPRINTAITGGSGVITGNFTVQEANEVALLLRAGSLPAPLRVIEERTVGPSLGADSINAGFKACLIGISMVIVFMIVAYKLFGVFANIALVINIALIMSALSLFGATLTLPGIAGIILTIGMAVDANVLIFERIREEVRENKKVVSAVDNGFSSAYKTILDANITTFIISIILYIFGSGPIRGFSVVLAVGVASSMFSAILLTRMMIVLWMNKYKPQAISL